MDVGLGGHGDLRRVVPTDSWGWEGGHREARKQNPSGDWPPSGGYGQEDGKRWLGGQSKTGYCRRTRSRVFGWDDRALATFTGEVERRRRERGAQICRLL